MFLLTPDKENTYFNKSHFFRKTLFGYFYITAVQ